jgi:hypothetical protein
MGVPAGKQMGDVSIVSIFSIVIPLLPFNTKHILNLSPLGAGISIHLPNCSNTPEAKVLQVIIPKLAPTSNITEPTELGLTYLTGYGQPITGTMAANVNLNVSGVSMYDGTPLSTTSADVTFYLDSTATLVNLNGQVVRRATVETVNNAS